MVEYKKYGDIIFKILTSIIVVTLLGSSGYFMIKFTPTYNEYYSHNGTDFVFVTRETPNLWDGTAKMRAKNRELPILIEFDEYNIIRKNATFKDNITLIEDKYFSKIDMDIEQFPYISRFTVYNGEGKIFSETFSKLELGIPTQDIDNYFSFDPKMKLEWKGEPYYHKYKNYKTTDDKIIIKFRVTKPVQTFEIRLYDPEITNTNITKNHINITEYIAKDKDNKLCLGKYICNIDGEEIIIDDKKIKKDKCKDFVRCYKEVKELDKIKINESFHDIEDIYYSYEKNSHFFYTNK